MRKADVRNLENIAPRDAALKLNGMPHERAYPAAALIQSLATSASSGESFTVPKPKASSTSSHSRPHHAPLATCSLNPCVTPTKPAPGGGEPLTPTSNLKVLVAASSAHNQPHECPPESDDFSTPKKSAACGGEPLTPTTNLKVLISAASPDIRNLVSRKQRPPPPVAGLSSDDDDGGDDDLDDTAEPDKKKCKKEYLCRKDKSLGLLCQKFISKFEEYPPHNAHIDVSLDELAKDLEVERRRIYDIVNVLESVEMMSRRAKNRYLWHGKTRLVETLVKLKQLAEAEGIQQQLNIVREYELSRMSADEPGDGDGGTDGGDGGGSSRSPSNVNLKQYMELFGNQMKKEKSLGIMSQKFLMLFLTSTKTINLDIAAKILIGDPTMDSSTNNAKFKTKIRRLYDIANILTSLNLIRKVHVTEVRGRKPAFQYVGPNVDTMSTASSTSGKQPTTSGEAGRPAKHAEQPAAPSAKRSLIRHASFDTICKVAETERTRLIASQPSSPVKAGADDDANGPKPRQYVMIQGAGPKMQVITTSQAPTFMAGSTPGMQRLTLIPVGSPGLPPTAGHLVFRAAMVDEMPRMCHFSPITGVTPLSSSSAGSLMSPFGGDHARSESFLMEGYQQFEEAHRLSRDVPQSPAGLVLRGTPASSNKQDDDFQVFRPVRMMATNICRANGPVVSCDQAGNQQHTPVQRGAGRNRFMSSLLNPARNLGKSVDLAAAEPFTGTGLRMAPDYPLAAPSISEVPLTTISPVRPVASFCSPTNSSVSAAAAGCDTGSSSSLKTPVNNLKTPVNDRVPGRHMMYTTPGFVPFASPPLVPTAFRPVQKTPTAHAYTETVRRLKLK